MARLEERLGVQLLHRTTRRLGLTEAGQGFYSRCQHAISEIEDAERYALDATGRPTGTLRVALTYDMARDLLSPLLPEFQRLYPDVSIELDMSHRRVDLIAEGIDVALRGGELPDSNLIARLITRGSMVLAASPAYLDEHGRPETLEQLAGHRGLVLRQGLVQGRWRLPGPDGMAVIPLEPWLVANEFSVVRQACIDGLGIAILEGNGARRALAAGQLERVLPEYGFAGGGGFYAIYPSTHHLTPKVRVFVDFIVDRFPKVFGPPEPPAAAET